MYRLTDYEYELPEDRIAQKPVPIRDRSRLMCLDRQTGGIDHRQFFDIAEILAPGDILVINDTRVMPGRLIGQKDSGGRIELLVLEYPSAGEAATADDAPELRCLVKASKKPKIGGAIRFPDGSRAEVLEGGDGVYRLRFLPVETFDALLTAAGRMPLPPYIRRPREDAADRFDYQTVYAARPGAVAAPTAGLHFSEALLNTLRTNGVTIVPITLHVGYGTFSPVREGDIRHHRIHSEDYHMTADTADTINTARAMGRRIVAVGTTCVRTLEYAADASGQVASGAGSCDLFIYPGYRFKVVDGLITNFHLPRSTLLMLVSAFAGRERMLAAYREAVAAGYRFYSYGDAMWIA